MKPIQLFTSMLAVATIVVTSCSAPRYAQQGTVTDDVYNSTAQAKEYTPVPVHGTQTQEPVYEDEYYGTNDPYYDMNYSSRINRFYYGSPWRNYYDPYFDYYAYGAYPWYGGMSMGWGNMYSPFLGYNNWNYGGYPWGWGWNNWGWNSYYGGGFLGGGYYGGGFYTGRTTNVPDYRPRPTRGNSSGYRPSRSAGLPGSNTAAPGRATRGQSYTPGSGRTSNVGTTRPSGNTTTRPSRGATTNTPPPSSGSRPSRPTYTPPQRTERPSYTPPPSTPTRSSGSSGSSGGSRGGSTGGGRPTRGGGR